MSLTTEQLARTRATRYVRPRSIADAVDLLAQDDATVLAGATDLVTLRDNGTVRADLLVDVKGIRELTALELNNDGAVIGAAVTMRELAALDDPALGALCDGAGVVGAPQTRARATIGGNACRASPAGDTLAALLVLDAAVELQTAGSTRTVPMRDFFTGPGQTVRNPDELAVRFHIPANDGGSAYERQTYRKWLDLAVAGVAVRVALGDGGACTYAAVALSASAPTPLLVPEAGAALVGTSCDREAAETAAWAVVSAASPIDDVRGTRDYRLRVLPALFERALTRALDRAAEIEDLVQK